VPPENILIVKPSSLGDVVHTLPAVALVKKRYPTARLRWLVNTEWAPLLEDNPDINEVIEFPRQRFRGLRGFARIAPWARQLRERAASDLVLDFQGLLRSALISRLCRTDGGKIVGLSDAREGAGRFYDATVDVSGAKHAVDRYLALVASLGHVADEPLHWVFPKGSPPPGHERLSEPFVLLHPFSRGKGKSLTMGQVVEFCRALAPWQVVIAGRGTTRIEPAPNIIDYLNRTDLHELIYLIRRARWVVSVDSGPMHIAAALAPRLVSIHTWSEPAKVGPYNPDAWIWKDGALSQMKSPAKREPASDITALATFVARML
jgi:heptosyltransferase I